MKIHANFFGSLRLGDLFDLIETLNREIKTGEKGFVIQILSDLIDHGLLKAIGNPNVFRNIFLLKD